jgi:Flp pilus assembly protein CpaB
MKKIIKLLILGILGVLLIFMIIGLISFYNASKTEDQIPIEMVAFNSLSGQESNLILVSPKDSNVKQVLVNNDIQEIIDTNYDKDQVYAVTFNNTATEATGNLVVYVGLDKKTVLGKGFTSN